MVRWFCFTIAASLVLSAGLFVVWSWRWPLVGDAALIHYIGFMVEKGWVPYRQLGDMNMPGAFLVEMAAMRVFGGGDLSWRLFDFSLLGSSAVCFQVVTRKVGWFAGVFAAGMFALVHGRDGLAEGGQRDLTMAVCLLAATAWLFCGVRWRNWWGFVGFGLFSGVALTIKPTALLVSLAQLAIAGWVLRQKPAGPTHQNRWMGHIWLAGLGILSGPGVAFGFLVRERAVGAFVHGLRTVVPYYASLGHRPLGFLLLHSVSPLLPLVLLWAAVLVVARPRLDWQRAVLGCGVVFGLVSYVVQARGLPYYRYPLLAFLLPLMAIDFTAAIAPERWNTLRVKAAGGLAVVALCLGGVIGVQSVVLAHRYRWWETDFISSLQGNLERLGGSRLSGNIQCVDSISGCGATLYRMRLLPATGVLSDFLLFGPQDIEAVREARASFQEGVEARPPEVIVVSSWLHMDGPDHYLKLDRWPWLQDDLAREYRLDTDWSPRRRTRWWSREETPAGYRIYVRR